MTEDEIGKVLVDSAVRVHKAIGPGLLESAYEACLVHVLKQHGLQVASQVELPVSFEGVRIEAGYRIDLLVEGKVVVELKAVELLRLIHTAQLLSYLKLGGYKLGFLLNFNVPLMRNGIKRLVNQL
ncbi:MAG: GxxExxY protein [Hydrogenophilaceae bacterium]|nr:GxxExxY protein [Hydrogenophilaceae bacterium]